MRSLNHIDIVGTISYGQSNSLGVMFFDHIDHLCFLAGRGTAHYYSMALPQYFEESFFHRFRFKNNLKSYTLDEDAESILVIDDVSVLMIHAKINASNLETMLHFLHFLRSSRSENIGVFYYIMFRANRQTWWHVLHLILDTATRKSLIFSDKSLCNGIFVGNYLF